MKNETKLGEVTMIRHFDHNQNKQIISLVKNMGLMYYSSDLGVTFTSKELDEFFTENCAYNLDDSEIEIADKVYASTHITWNNVIYFAEQIPETSYYKVTTFVKTKR